MTHNDDSFQLLSFIPSQFETLRAAPLIHSDYLFSDLLLSCLAYFEPNFPNDLVRITFLQLIIHQGPKFNLKLRKNIILICIINMLDINGKFFSKLGGLGCTL